MISTYHLTEKELTPGFLKMLKTLFKDKAITLTVEEETDTTEYLLSSPANKEHLLKGMAESKAGKGTVMTVDELKNFAKSK